MLGCCGSIASNRGTKNLDTPGASFINSAYSVKEVYVTSHTKVMIYKNKLDRRMCAPSVAAEDKNCPRVYSSRSRVESHFWYTAETSSGTTGGNVNCLERP